MSYLIFNGENTKNYNLKMTREFSFLSAKKETDFQKIKGVDGEVDLADGTFSNVEQDFAFVWVNSNEDIKQISNKVSNWLNKDNLWHNLEFGGDSDYIYIAKYNSQMDIERVLSSFGKVILTFTLKPYKYLKTGLNEIVLPQSITNTTNRTAKPILTIKGTGNITVTIGKSVLTLKNVESGVRIDSLAQTITTLDKTRNLFTNMTSYPFPVIEPGTQKITVTGTTTEIKIIPRWEVIV